MTHSWFQWLRRGSARKQAPRTRRTSQPRRPSVPQLLVLEDRTLLSLLTVLSNADSGAGSLRDTLAAAQNGDTIVFDPSLAYETITLSSGPLALSSNITIDGLGANLLAISGNNASQLFTLSGAAQVTLSNLTLTGGLSSQGGAVFIGRTAALTLDNDILAGNQAVGDTHGNALGGAVYNSAGASLTIDNTSFVNNQTNGTNQSFGGALANAGTLAINGANFTGNAARDSTASFFGSSPGGSQGGGIVNLDGATATIILSTFTGNQALGTGTGDADGGVLCNEVGGSGPFAGVTCTVSQCTFDNNMAQRGSSTLLNSGYGGGAIEDGPGTNLAVLTCSFTGNQARNSGGANAAGGAIDNSLAVTVTISGSQFFNNSAIASGLSHAAQGGALDNPQTMTITNSQFISNSAIGGGVGTTADGGAVFNSQSMTISNCLFTGNSAAGGLMANGNTAPYGQGLGGAIFTGEGFATGLTVILTLSNSTVAGNEAIGGSGGTLVYPRTDAAFGGGMMNLNGGTLNVAGCTITGNEALGGASASGSGGVALGGASKMTMRR